MKTRLAAAILLLAAATVRAETEIVLEDGQVLRGTAVRREGSDFLIELGDGHAITLPAELVSRVRLAGEPPAPRAPRRTAAPGLVAVEPRTLAGEYVAPPKTSDQLAALGPAAKFREDIVPNDWTPTSDWNLEPSNNDFAPSTWSKAPIDSTSKPESAWDPRKNVLESTASTWRSSPVDSSWKPKDGFRRQGTSFALTAAPPGATAEAAVAPQPVVAGDGSRPVGAWSCAETLFAGAGEGAETVALAAAVDVRAVEDPRIRALPVALYEARGSLAGAERRAVFAMSAGECRLVGGDFAEILGVELSDEQALARALASYNGLVGAAGWPARSQPDHRPLEHGEGVLALTDPRVSGARAARVVTLAGSRGLADLAQRRTAACELGRGKRKKQTRLAEQEVTMPRIVVGPDGHTVTFYTWSAAGGEVWRNEVWVSRDGIVSIERREVASHVGDHHDAPPAPFIRARQGPYRSS